ncbi:glycosyltransferase family 2 protein [Crocosphaera chwakensis]|uniref:Glycosyl transferase, group 2 family protein n=1 Tax=Crocosphaera chwakensis CCY0110 TaxID=391612 RepID=A3IUT0_9CHRO|nr:glycosyltransferase family 2 protein [Crocosphaera chwakensis]EAZ89773.1 glycosyl transferase, group 2 family protein [Crocosphaera chwakensis CCY0110]
MTSKQLLSVSTIFIVIVNYKTPELTIDCLKSLTQEIPLIPDLKVAVVDNDSQDGSVEKIQDTIKKERFSSWVSLIPSNKNGGFSFGNNLAIRPVLNGQNPPAYFLLLNPDTVIHFGAIKTLINFMNNHPEIGIAGSRLEEPDGTPQRSAFRFPSIFSEFDNALRLGIVSKLLKRWIVAPPVPENLCQTDWVAGASMIIRREVFEAIGLLDEEYFMYFEEVDFCLKANKAGWLCWYVPDSRVIHFVGQSSGVTNTKIPPKRRPQYWFDSRQRFFIKNYGLVYAALTDFVALIGFILWKIRANIQGKVCNLPPQFLGDFWNNAVWMKRKSQLPS